ncbi:hypothetical protein ACFFJY_12350 [Fictibacillus aquaticus]|uniref:Uncharacterized protein n=1 Tax=Fictibacillus aquaticus TaxID=2021314 RepID=A0A235FDL6_9BACL|nr:hypothetical protein [Fictibacillus aquaticus]OYD59033.1 hypothetical protein CGZ90_03785 [Fictibacillus aquaticus]
MNAQEKLSYERLISRTEYYKEKALDLEKKLLFAEEQIEKLENDLNTNGNIKTLELKEKELAQLKTDLEDLQYKLRLSQADELEKRIKGYEDLLGKIQIELNEKDQQIDLYQQRVKSMEKRMSINRMLEPSFEGSMQTAGDNTAAGAVKEDFRCTGYFDYSVIFTEEKNGFIRGSFTLENTGVQPLSNPHICFRFLPAEAAAMKGKILSMISNPSAEEIGQSQWMYMDNDWAAEAKDRGELWVCPLKETVLLQGARISLNDFQIPFKKQIDNHITVEAFVYFHKENYKIRAANHIAVNF